MTCVFFLLLEGLLAVVGVSTTVETRDPFVGFASSLPTYVKKTGADGQVTMTTAENKLAYFNAQSFPQEKPAGTYRIFCLGGSTTYGRPYDDATSFSEWLRQLLPIVDSGKDWEVINAGGISYATYRIAALMEQLVRYQPDLFVIYTGHNEFLEERTYGKMQGMSPVGIDFMARLAHTRTFALVENLLRPNSGDPYQMSAEVDAVLDHTSGPATYHRDEELAEQILAHFEFNLSRMAKLARDAGADVVFVAPAGNLKDFSPFKSQNSVAKDSDDYRLWSSYLADAEKLEAANEYQRALTAYEAAEKIDDRYADLHFRKGHLLFQLKQYSAATAAFQRAADEDVCPLRATSAGLERMREAAKQADVPLVDFQRDLRSECQRKHGHEVPGNEYFLDHVHPNIETNGMIARAIVDRLIEMRVVQATGTWQDTGLSRARQQIESNIDTQDHAVALRNLAKVLEWAGKHEEAGLLAAKALETAPEDVESLRISAAHLMRIGKTDQAIEYLRMILTKNPNQRNRADAHRLLAAALIRTEQPEQALIHFQELVRLRPDDTEAHEMIGMLQTYLQSGSADEPGKK